MSETEASDEPAPPQLSILSRGMFLGSVYRTSEGDLHEYTCPPLGIRVTGGAAEQHAARARALLAIFTALYRGEVPGELLRPEELAFCERVRTATDEELAEFAVSNGEEISILAIVAMAERGSDAYFRLPLSRNARNVVAALRDRARPASA